MTNVPPAIPIKVLKMDKSRASRINPVHAVGMAAPHKQTLNKIRAPYLSHSGPTKKRTKMVPPTPAIDDVQMSLPVKSNVSLISGSKGLMANQMKKAIKKDHL